MDIFMDYTGSLASLLTKMYQIQELYNVIGLDFSTSLSAQKGINIVLSQVN